MAGWRPPTVGRRRHFANARKQSPPARRFCFGARLSRVELEIRLPALHRERLVGERTRVINELRWQLHDLSRLGDPQTRRDRPAWQTKIARRLARAETTVQVQVVRDMIARVRPHDHQALPAARRPRHTDRAAADGRASQICILDQRL
jgi:hypothetical protein